MSKIEAGRASLTSRPFDLHALLDELESMFAFLAAEKGVELRFEFDRALCRVLDGDAVKVRQVAINLLSNAVKFTEHGKIEVRASSRPVADGRVAVEITV